MKTLIGALSVTQLGAAVLVYCRLKDQTLLWSDDTMTFAWMSFIAANAFCVAAIAWVMRRFYSPSLNTKHWLMFVSCYLLLPVLFAILLHKIPPWPAGALELCVVGGFALFCGLTFFILHLVIEWRERSV